MEEKIRLRESTPLDSDQLSQFFSKVPTQGDIQIKIQRQVDFFSLYRRLNIQFSNYILEDQQEILGTASFLHQDYKINQINTKTSFACDLRISQQRKAILNWSKHFLPQMEYLTQSLGTEHFITTINLDNTQAINAFIRTKQKKILKPLYELVSKFNLVSIHGFYPLSFTLNEAIKTQYATPEYFPQMIKYLQTHLKELDLVPHQYAQHLELQLHDSLIYSLRQFIIAIDSKNQIIGCCYALSSTLLQDYFPQTYSPQANNFRQFLKLASLMGFARKLTKPFSSTQKDQTLQFQFLHFLFFDHPDVFKSLVSFAYKQSHQNEFLIYSYENTLFNYRPPLGTINTETTYGLYEIRSPQSFEKVSLKQKIKKNIWLDGLVF